MVGEEGHTGSSGWAEDGHRPALRLGGGRHPRRVQRGGDGRHQHGRRPGLPVTRKRIRCRAAIVGDEKHRRGRVQGRATGPGRLRLGTDGAGRAATAIDGTPLDLEAVM